MTRQEAIDTIGATWYQRDSEFCVSQREYYKSELELRECLRALGCTEEEIGPAPEEPPPPPPAAPVFEVSRNEVGPGLTIKFTRHYGYSRAGEPSGVVVKG